MIIRRYENDAEAFAAADIMATTEPWISYGRTREMIFANVTNPLQESYIAILDNEVVGIVIIAMQVPLIKGYVAALAVKSTHRGGGIGSSLLKFAEERILGESPNVFLCVTSFNTNAQRLYERLGYQRVGTISDFAIAGADEFLMRKTTGPQSTFRGRPVVSAGHLAG